MSSPKTLSDADLVQIIQAYYNAVDSLDPERISGAYSPEPSTTLQFNADAPLIGIPAIKGFSARFGHVVSSIKHTKIDIWARPLMGDIVPVDLQPARSSSTVTVVSTALPTFTITKGTEVTRLPVPATSIFTLDIASRKFVSVHNMFDIAKVFAAVGG